MLKVCFIQESDAQASDIPQLFNERSIAYHRVATVNWKAYSYCPQVQFAIAYTHEAILLHFKVTEKSIRAKYAQDNGKVWTDSCVEFFSIPAGDGIYYNIECNCIGTLLLGSGPQREGRELASLEVIRRIQRWSSLPAKPFEEIIGEQLWEVALLIPYAAFFKHHITSLQGQTVKGNFYKCGDELTTPHFLSWNPIPIEKPDFHRPDCFGDLCFE